MLCPAYNDQNNGIKHGKSKYYEEQIKHYIISNPNITADAAYQYFNNGDCTLKPRTFKDKYYKIRSSINNTNNYQINTIPNKQYTIDQPTQQSYNNAFNELKYVIHKLGLNTDLVSQRTKQILLSALCSVDNDGKLTNECLVRNIAPNINV